MPEILLTKHKLTYVDDEAYEVLAYYPWNSYESGSGAGWKNKTTIAGRTIFLEGTRATIYLHRVIAGVPQCFRVKFLNGNKLDNRHENLQIHDKKGNLYSFTPFTGKSEYEGVIWNKWHGLWEAQYHKLSIGFYPNEVDAARAYNVKMREIDQYASPRSKYKLNTILIMNKYLRNNGEV